MKQRLLATVLSFALVGAAFTAPARAIFTGGTKLAEHGGFNEDDVHVALLLSSPSLVPRTVKTPVSNQQVPASILKILGIDPNELDAVRKEQVHALPFLFTEGGGNY